MPQPVFFFLNHPAHYHLFKHAINRLIADGLPVRTGIVKKDILEDLVRKERWDYVNLFPEGRRYKNLPIVVSSLLILGKAEWRLWKEVRTIKPSILVGTEGTLAHTGRLCAIPSLLFNEDDTRATPENHLFYPFATKVILPASCDPGMWQKKRVSYRGYHELAYLRPNLFTPRRSVVDERVPKGEKFFLLRLAELSASHDIGRTGITDDLVREVLKRLTPRGRVFITSERALKAEFEPYRLAIDPQDIFHFMSFADLYIGDSQTMAAEAAVLGTPSIRFNDFVGCLGYLDELEYRFQLTFGIKTTEVDRLFSKLDEILSLPNPKETWQQRRQRMLGETDDVVALTVRLIKDHMKP